MASQSIAVFQFESNSVRAVVSDEGKPLFVAKDVADILGYNQTSDGLTHCKRAAVMPELNKINKDHNGLTSSL